MIAHFFHGLGGNRTQLFIAALHAHPLPQQLQPGGEHGVAQHGECKITARQLGQRHIEVIAFIAQKSQLVFIMAIPFHLPGQCEHGARLPNKIERNVGHGNVLFQDRRMAAPFTDALGQDQAAVTDAQQVLRRRRYCKLYGFSRHGFSRDHM
ncbi:hypothetical protein D3C72_1509010 [compost metagenome]